MDSTGIIGSGLSSGGIGGCHSSKSMAQGQAGDHRRLRECTVTFFRRLSADSQSNLECASPPQPFSDLESTFGTLVWEDYKGDFEERLVQEPLMPKIKESKEVKDPPMRSLWSKFVEGEEISDFTDLESIRAVAERIPQAQKLVDATCEKVTNFTSEKCTVLILTLIALWPLVI